MFIYILLGFFTFYLIFKSFSMGLTGAILGIIIYQSKSQQGFINHRNIKFESSEFPGTKDSFIFFSQCTFSVMGYISKAKGRVTENDIRIAVDFMDQLALKGEIRKISQTAFNKGKSYNFDINNVLREFYQEFHGNNQIIDLFLEIQIKICFSDANIDQNEINILSNIAQQLNISDNYILNKISLYKNMYNFEHSSNNYNQAGYKFRYNKENSTKYKHKQSSYNNQYQDDNRFQQRSYNKNTSNPLLKDAYAILGVKEQDNHTIVKTAYRKLMNEYHPDKLAAKKIPKEYYEIYNKKSQQIIKSYNLICEHKGWK